MTAPTYLRLYTGTDGESHFAEEDFPLHDLGAGSSLLRATPFEPAVEYGLRVVPAGWERDWGPASRRTVAIYLGGRAEIEASDGEVRQLEGGTVLLAEDVEGRGHRAGVIGDEAVTVMHIVLPA